MNRRDSLFALSALGLARAAPHAAVAQQARAVQEIGIVWGTFPEASRVLFEPLRDGLRDFGYVEGRNIVFHQRWGEGKPERIPEIMDSLVRLKVDAIVVPINAIIADARRATSTVPIVMLYAMDPVGAGFVSSLAKPGGNITGMSMGQDPATFAKNIQLLKQAGPHLSTVVLLSNPDAPNMDGYLKAIEDVARPLGISLRRQNVRTLGEIDAALSAIRSDNRTALLVFPDAATFAGRAQIAQWAIKNRVSATASFPDFAQASGLMAYGANLPALGRYAANHIHKILKGAKPGDLPVELPTKFDLVINLKTAKLLGLTIPSSLLIQAEQVIE